MNNYSTFSERLLYGGTSYIATPTLVDSTMYKQGGYANFESSKMDFLSSPPIVNYGSDSSDESNSGSPRRSIASGIFQSDKPTIKTLPCENTIINKITRLADHRFAVLDDCKTVTVWNYSSKGAPNVLGAFPCTQDGKIPDIATFGDALLVAEEDAVGVPTVLSVDVEDTENEPFRFPLDETTNCFGCSFLCDVNESKIAIASSKAIDGVFLVGIISINPNDRGFVGFGHESKITAMISPQMGLLLTGSEDSKIRYFNTSSMETGSLDAHDKKITGLATLGPSKFVSCSANDGKTILWDIETQANISIGNPGSPVQTLATFEDQLIATAVNHTVTIWDIREPKKIGTIQSFPLDDQVDINALSFMHDGDLIIGAGSHLYHGEFHKLAPKRLF